MPPRWRGPHTPLLHFTRQHRCALRHTGGDVDGGVGRSPFQLATGVALVEARTTLQLAASEMSAGEQKVGKSTESALLANQFVTEQVSRHQRRGEVDERQ